MSIKTPQQKTEEDLKKFEKRFGFLAYDKKYIAPQDFVRQLLQSRDSYWLKRIEEELGEEKWDINNAPKMLNHTESTFYLQGFNSCREEVLKRLLK